MARYLPLIVIGVLLNALAQLALKQGMRHIGHFDFRLGNSARILLAVAASPYILAGLACYIVSVAVWLLVLSRVEVSYAYPLLSIGYIVTAFAGWLFFQEAWSYPMDWYCCDLHRCLADYPFCVTVRIRCLSLCKKYGIYRQTGKKQF